MMKLPIIYIILFLSLSANSQSRNDYELAKTILGKVQNVYINSAGFDYNIEYKMFRAESSKAEKEYNGRVYKKNNSIYYKILNTETFTTDKTYLRVSHDQKLMEYGKPKVNNDNIFPQNVTNYLNHFPNVIVTDKNSHWVCTMTVGKITPLNYNKVVLIIGKDYSLHKQTLYLIKKIPFKDSHGKEIFDFPRIEVTLSKKIAIKNAPSFNLSQYINIYKGKAVATQKYKNYKVMNLN